MKKIFLVVMLVVLSCLLMAQKWEHWQNVGDTLNVAVDLKDMCVTTKGDTVYVAYTDIGGITVRRYDGKWALLGIAGFSDEPKVASISMVVDAKNTPYVGYCEGSNPEHTGCKEIRQGIVEVFLDDTWMEIGCIGDCDSSKFDVKSIAIAVDSKGVIYEADCEGVYPNHYGTYYQREEMYYRVMVRKFEDGVWKNVGSYVSDASTSANNVSIIIDGNDVPIVSYSERPDNNIFNRYKVVVKRFDGVEWVDTADPGCFSEFDYKPQIAIDANNTIFLGYCEDKLQADRHNTITVKRFTGTSWKPVGPIRFSKGTYNGKEFKFSLSLDKIGMPYVAYRSFEYVNTEMKDRIEIMKYNGTDWVALESPMKTFFDINGFGCYNYPYPMVCGSDGAVYFAYVSAQPSDSYWMYNLLVQTGKSENIIVKKLR